MRFYVATGFERAEAHAQIVKAIEDRGHRCTFEWSRPEVLELPLRIIALAEVQALQCADILIVSLPGGRGTHGELVAALALGKRVIIWAGEDTGAAERVRSDSCPFYHHPSVEVFQGQLSALVRMFEGER